MCPGRYIIFAIILLSYTFRKRAKKMLQYKASYDLLTGLPNRLMFIDRLSLLIAQSERKKEMFEVMFMDIDRFKLINGTLGHDMGDKLLIDVARKLKENLRGGESS